MPRWAQHYWFQPCTSHSPISGFPSSFWVATVISLLSHPFVDSANTECAFHATLLSECWEYLGERNKQLCLHACWITGPERKSPESYLRASSEQLRNIKWKDPDGKAVCYTSAIGVALERGSQLMRHRQTRVGA